ncbi:metal-binding protein [Geminocystis sp. GBBB08]|uniref:metal-binding protein n=1 Tax=Geminocystis sp. GBBB08 TaxID=2604140 RepID=UPI0027E26D57|nr:metal-binding protein [Geminocystis sp. GBBB08]MBL1211598.1 metal-binding protein [Geminocystis sp. GBBB08]
MPSGKNHDRITWICLPIVSAIFLIFTARLDLTFFASIGFIFSALMFGPDLDIFSIQYQRWRFFKFLWLPYQKTFKHRSFFSHGFLIGTIIRVFYLSFILLILAFLGVAITQLFWGFNWHWQKFMVNAYTIVKNQYWREVLSLFIGLELGAMSHYVADNIDSWRKSVKKPPRSRKKILKKNTQRVKNK